MQPADNSVLGGIAQLDFLSFEVSRTVTSLWDLPNPFVERIDLNFLASSCSVRDIAALILILFIQQKKSITSCCETNEPVMIRPWSQSGREGQENRNADRCYCYSTQSSFQSYCSFYQQWCRGCTCVNEDEIPDHVLHTQWNGANPVLLMNLSPLERSREDGCV
jgi:hypothetical protein